jgi:hypothetical protein
MDEPLIEIRGYHGEGYQPLIDFGEWRVAFLRYLEDIQPDLINSMERHTKIDEVFVLLNGRGALIIGGNDAEVDCICSQRMEFGKVYNIKRLAWHTILLSHDATVLLVENRDTSKYNSEYASLSPIQRGQIIEIARHESFERY